MKNYTTSILALLIVICVSSAARAEYVFMKDGAITEGKIISDAAESIVLKEKDGKNRQIERKKILRVLYTSLNMAKLYVQKRDGSSFVAYLVDEDRDDYTFRRELYKPEEFKASRKDVLFMSEKNPSALKGDSGPDEIRLSWLAPYGQVKVYKIYTKQRKEDEYKVAATTKKNEITIKGLEMKTAYFFIVRAVDDTDYETNPSNEIQVITKSSLPGSPVIQAVKDRNGAWAVTWNASADADGSVEGYRVYAEKDGKYALLKETKELSFTVPGGTVYDTIQVRSLDNNGDESLPVDYRHDWRFQISPQVWIPVADMRIFAGTGWGGAIDVSKRGLFLNDLELGGTLGGMTFEGKKKIGDDNSNVNTLYMFPAAAFAAYRVPFIFDAFNCYDVLSFFPKISAGIMTVSSDYEILDNSGAVEEKKSAVMLAPFVKAGAFAEYGLTRNFFFTLGSEFTYIIDKTPGLCMVSISASTGYRF